MFSFQRSVFALSTFLLIHSFARSTAQAAPPGEQQAQVERRGFERFHEDRESLSSPGSRAELRALAAPSPQEPKPWEVTFDLSGGYDSNPEGTHGGQGSLMTEFDGTFAFDAYRNGAYNADPMLSYVDQFTITYEFDGKLYEGDFVDADEIDQILTGTYHHRFSDQFRFSLDVDDEYDYVGGFPFLNKLEAKPALRYMIRPWAGFEGIYTYRHLEYLFTPSISTRDPDAERHTIGGNLLLFPKDDAADKPGPLIKGLFSSLAIGYAHSWNFADGSDFDYRGDEISVKVNGLRLWTEKRLVSSIKYSHLWNDYLHANSNSPTGKSRYDQIDRFTFELDYTLLEKDNGPTWKLYARYELNNQQSNLAVKDFDEHVVRIGLTFDY